jgi:hypothetical protein
MPELRIWERIRLTCKNRRQRQRKGRRGLRTNGTNKIWKVRRHV